MYSTGTVLKDLSLVERAGYSYCHCYCRLGEDWAPLLQTPKSVALTAAGSLPNFDGRHMEEMSGGQANAMREQTVDLPSAVEQPRSVYRSNT